MITFLLLIIILLIMTNTKRSGVETTHFYLKELLDEMKKKENK